MSPHKATLTSFPSIKPLEQTDPLAAAVDSCPDTCIERRLSDDDDDGDASDRMAASAKLDKVESDDLESQPLLPSPLHWYKCKRYHLTLLSSCSVFLIYLHRYVLSQAILPMAHMYDWNQTQQGYLQSAFHIGCLLTQLLGGYYSQRFGGKHVVGFAVLLSSVCCAISPLVAVNYPVFLVVRIIMGFAQGLHYPAMIDLQSHWALPHEISFAINFSFSGGQLGTIFVMACYPSLAELVNWAFPFYLFAGMGVLWYCAWVFHVFNSPSQHPSLAPQERELLQNYQARSSQSTCDPAPTTFANLPWKKLFTARPVLVLVSVFFTFNWTFYLLMNNLPKYLHSVILVPPRLLGVFSMIPYIGFWFFTVVSALLSDMLVSRGMRTIAVRKWMLAIGFLPCSILLLICLPLFSPMTQAASCLWLLYTVISCSGIAKSGFAPTALDLSPEFAGLITSVCFVFAGLAGILSPITSGHILANGMCTDTYPQPASCLAAWHLVFRVSGSVFLLGLVLWVVFASADRLKLTDATGSHASIYASGTTDRAEQGDETAKTKLSSC